MPTLFGAAETTRLVLLRCINRPAHRNYETLESLTLSEPASIAASLVPFHADPRYRIACIVPADRRFYGRGQGEEDWKLKEGWAGVQLPLPTIHGVFARVGDERCALLPSAEVLDRGAATEANFWPRKRYLSHATSSNRPALDRCRSYIVVNKPIHTNGGLD
jgi:hypothetical protein